MFEALERVLYFGIYVTAFKSRDNGGYSCFTEMTKLYKYSVYFLMILLELFIFKKLRHLISNKQVPANQNRGERILGWVAIGTVALLFFIKAYYNTLMFIINPCHVSCVC